MSGVFRMKDHFFWGLTVILSFVASPTINAFSFSTLFFSYRLVRYTYN